MQRLKKFLPLGLLLLALGLFVAGCGEGFDLHHTEHELNFWGLSHEPWRIGPGPFWEVNSSTMIFTWVAMAACLLIGFVAARTADVRRPTKLQSLFEMLMEWLGGLINEVMDPKKGAGIFLLIVTYFYFIFISNVMGLIPTLEAPTADNNTTFGLALITFFMIYIWGIRYKGIKYFKHYIEPVPVFLPITIIEDLAKPLTLAFRLFGNMKGKHIMTVALLGLITGTTYWAGGFLASVIWLAFGLFVSFIQAFVFAMLSIAYISMAVAEEH
ncbi:MAG: F0F1 ATP synthase subunit A [Bacillota bacterium]